MIKKLQKIDQSNDSVNSLSTFDLGAAASLITAGFELVSMDKSNPRKVQFLFRQAVGIKKVIDDYWADRLEVRARALFDNTKMLKNRIYSE